MYFIGILLKIVSSVFYLFSGLFWKTIIPKHVNYHVIYHRTLFSILFSIITIFTFKFLDPNSRTLIDMLKVDISSWVATIGICCFSFYGLYFFTNALKNGRYSIVTPFVSSAAIFSFITSYIIYDENITIFSIFAFLILMIGLVIHQYENITNLKLSKEIFLAILSAFFWGVSFVLYPFSINKFGIYNFSLILEICVFLSCIYLLIIKEKKIVPKIFSKSELAICFLIGLCVAGGNVSANYSLDNMPIYLNIIISVLFEAIVIIIGVNLFKERLKTKDWILITTITICSVLTFY